MSAFESSLYDALIVTGYVLAAIVFVTLFFITAPYGRHSRSGWGPMIDRRLCWMIMESGAVIFFTGFFLLGNGLQPGMQWLFVAAFLVHYLHRAFVFPLRMKGPPKQNPLAIALMALVFNAYNGYLNGRYLGVHADAYDVSWLSDPRFIIGAILFVAGFAINYHSDEILFRMRRTNEGEYRIPKGGLYRWITCPNYFGEILEWTGWAIATWSAPGLVFLVWTIANLAPRAYSNHLWYHKTFDDYPKTRKALIPFLF